MLQPKSEQAPLFAKEGLGEIGFAFYPPQSPFFKGGGYSLVIPACFWRESMYYFKNTGSRPKSIPG